MKLHIFNPEHDIALAANQECFTAPHAGRRLRTDLGFIPAFWASEGDMVLVDDVEAAIEARRHLRKFGNDVVFVTAADLKNFTLDDVKNNCCVLIKGLNHSCQVTMRLLLSEI